VYDVCEGVYDVCGECVGSVCEGLEVSLDVYIKYISVLPVHTSG
jgi:hypothetical protein